jgi:hypothetical protein
VGFEWLFILGLNVFFYCGFKFLFSSIPHFMKIPVIAFSSVEGNQQTNEMTKNPVNPAVNPNNLLELSDEMNFTERIKNSAVNLVELYYYQ